ncbi:MAG: polysaccharide biosynthesis C-terminal domain-containing protein, partial [Firmicutes bacterium]|nr:polysaccharide biosynthesis C-terminal domain-containing protein [Bacillota bacterium]
ILAYLLLPRGLEFAAGGASFGVVIGSAFGLALLALIYWYRGQQLRFPGGGADEPGREGVGRIALEITRLSVPITLAALVSPIIQLIDTVIVPRRLQIAGFTPEAATGLYGQLTGFAAPLMNLPQIFTVALAASLVPAVSEALALGQSSRVRNRVEAAMKLTLLIALPSTLGLILLARPISQMLYNTPEAGIPLAGLAAGITFLLLHQTTTGALQGLGKTHIPVQNLLLGAAVKAVMNFTLTAIPSIHILGAALGTSAGFLVAAVLNVIALRRLVGFPFPWRDGILKPMLASAAMALTVTAFYRTILELYGSNTLGTLIAIAGGAGIYGAVLILSKAVTEEELQMIPWFGPRFNEILRRLGLTGR